MKKPARKTVIASLVLSAIIGILAFAPVWLRNNGQLMIFGDYYPQMVPFTRELRRMLESGSLSWSWNSFLGDSFVGAYSYYTVFNPFAWIIAMFPDSLILYGMMLATIAKFALCAYGSLLYMRRFCEKDSFALIGALLYTFSGFTIVNTYFYFFWEVIAVFPFMMYGLELLLTERKPAVYVFTLAFHAALNYYMFVSTVFLTVLYVVLRLELYKVSGWKANFRQFLDVAIFSVLGTGMAGIALIPSLYSMLESGKAMDAIGTVLTPMYWVQNILERIRIFLAPIESISHRAFYDASTWSSTGIYPALFGCVLVFQWCLQKKDWIKKFCLILIVCCFIPILNSIFNLFSNIHYTRWMYALSLVFSLATALSLEEIAAGKQRFSRKLLLLVTLCAAGILAAPTLVYFLHRAGVSLPGNLTSLCYREHFMGYAAILAMVALTAANYAGLWYVALQKHFREKTVIWLVAFFCLLNFFVFNELNYDLNVTEYGNDEFYAAGFEKGSIREGSDFEYRIDHPEHLMNYSMFMNRPSVNYYNSIQNPGSLKLAVTLGMASNVADTTMIMPDQTAQYADTLLSVRYFYDYDGNAAIPEGFAYLRTENQVDIYENVNFIPMGFCYDTYILESQLETLPQEARALAMLHSMVVAEKDEALVSQYLRKAEPENDLTSLSDAAAARRETACSTFKGTSSGFTAETELAKDSIVFFSIPNVSGWKITVNGTPAEIIGVNCGLMGIRCSAGYNQITGTFHTRGLELGALCSIAFILLWIVIRRRLHTCQPVVSGKKK